MRRSCSGRCGRVADPPFGWFVQMVSPSEFEYDGAKFESCHCEQGMSHREFKQRRFWRAILGLMLGAVCLFRCNALLAEKHWAFTPLRAAEFDSRSELAAIDQLLAGPRLAAGVTANRAADRVALVRRMFFDLNGLPPTIEEVNSFCEDRSPEAVQRLVEDLLGRLEFGERWGRHWLDVARYADSNGCSIEANNTYDNAWRYRDYVIAALNADKPFDQFVVQQIAGDLLPWVTTTERSENLIATGFLLFGPKAFGTGSFDQLRLDTVDDQIDTIGKAFLGMTFGCARCHDHKEEPFSTDDYYALAGIFGSTQSLKHEAGWRAGKTWNRVPLPVLEASESQALRKAHQQRLEAARAGKLVEQAEEELKAAKVALEQLQAQADPEAAKLAELRQRVTQAERVKRNAGRLAKVLQIVSPVPAAMAVVEIAEPRDEPIRLGGDPEEKDTAPARRVWSIPGWESSEKYAIPSGQSGRMQLAEWLVDVREGAGELVARVTVNRIWQHLMGQPLVETVDNFGLSGKPPTHPRLLDYLATRLIEEDWSVKQVVREIVLSDAYQLSSQGSAESLQVDPANRYYWRRTPRRLDAETLRDAQLAISGRLDRSRGGKTLQHLGLITIRSDMIELDTPSPYLRRTVYLPVIRDAVGISEDIDQTTAMAEAFDRASPNLVCGRRDSSTRPEQALFLMNSEFVFENAKDLAGALLKIASPEERVQSLFRQVLSRAAHAKEVEECLALVRQLEDAAVEPAEDGWTGLCQVVMTCNEFLFLP